MSVVHIPKEYKQTKGQPKKYYARVANSRFIFEDGTEIIFVGGMKEVDIVEHQLELDKVLGKNPNIYIPNVAIEALPEVAQNARSEADIKLQDKAILQTNKGKVTETGDTNDGVVVDITASAADASLQAAAHQAQTRGGAPITAISKAPDSAAMPSAGNKG